MNEWNTFNIILHHLRADTFRFRFLLKITYSFLVKSHVLVTQMAPVVTSCKTASQPGYWRGRNPPFLFRFPHSCMFPCVCACACVCVCSSVQIYLTCRLVCLLPHVRSRSVNFSACGRPVALAPFAAKAAFPPLDCFCTSVKGRSGSRLWTVIPC